MALTMAAPGVAPNPLAGAYPGSTPATEPVEVAPENAAAPAAAPNVGTGERIACAAAGGLLALYGLSRRSVFGLAPAAAGGALLYRGATGRCAAYDRMGVNTAEPTAPSPRQFERTAMVRRPASDCYLLWRHFDNAPRFMGAVRSVKVIDDRHSHWEVATPLGGTLAYDAFVYEDVEGERIAWRTLPGAAVGMAGSVTFTNLSDLNLTAVRVELRLNGAAAWTGSAARLFGLAPDQQLARDLGRFKELLESGAPVPFSEGFGSKPRWRKSKDVVEAASDQSFPASDPPSWTH